jgi:hypothetical protein
LDGKAYFNQIEAAPLCTSSKTGEGIEELRQLLAECSHLPRYGQEVPLRWFKFHSIVKEMASREHSYARISYEQAFQIANVCRITEEPEFRRMLR